MGVQFYHTLQSTSSFRCLCVAQCPYFIITIVIYLQQALSPFPFPMIIYLPPVHLFHASHPSMQCSKTSGRPSTIYFWISNLPPNQIFLDILDFERKNATSGAAFWCAAVSLKPPGAVLPASASGDFVHQSPSAAGDSLRQNPIVSRQFNTSHQLGESSICGCLPQQ